MAYLRFLFVVLSIVALFGPNKTWAATLNGVVLDADGVAISGATVWVTQRRQVRTLTSDEAGRFTATDIDVALTEVVGYKAGLALGGATALVAGDAPVEIRLMPGDLITVKVIDTASNPVPGATVRTMMINGSFVVSVEDLVPHGLPPMRSDDSGILTIAPLPQDGFVQLELSHPRFADASVSYLPVAPDQPNILLQEGKRVGGRVTYDGKGIVDVRVSLFKAGPQGQKEFAEVLTDAEGFFFARVHPGHYGVAVQHVDYASPAPVPVEVAADGETESLAITLESPRYITGSVQYPDKKACGGARVIYRIENTVFQDTFTNNDGNFELRVPGGPGSITIVPPPGYQNPHRGDIPVDLGDVHAVSLNPIQLKALPVIEGTIRDEEGNNPGPVFVTLQNLPIPYNLLTDEAGRLSLPLNFMPDVETLFLRFEHGRRFQRRDIEIDLASPKPFDVKLEPFTPDLESREPVPGRNNLRGLVGKPAPALRGTEWVNSEPHPLSDLMGKVVVLFFWVGFDDDMGPVAIRELLALHTLFEGVDDVAFVGVHDACLTADEIREFVSNFAIPFPVLRDEDLQTTFSTYGIVRLPQVVLLDKKGNVRYFQTDDRLLTCIKGLRRE